MTAERLREEAPIWTASQIPGRMAREIKKDNFKRKHGLTILGAIFLFAWTIMTCCITGTIVKHNTQAEVEMTMRENFNAYLVQMEQEQAAARLLTGEESKETAIKKDAVLLARIGQGVMNTYHAADLEDAKKVMLCALCRVYSGGEFASIKSIEEAVKQKDQWWGYEDGMSYTEAVRDVAMEVSGIYHNGDPLPCNSDMVYAGWNGDQIVLRNRWEANANARYY